MANIILVVHSIFQGQPPKYIAVSDDVEKLKKFVESEQVETYTEEIDGRTYFKSFRKGGVLENYNVPSADDYKPFPTREDALRMEGDRYDRFMSRVIKVLQ